MCSSEYNNVFWSKVECEMHQKLPEIVKSILARTGFESELSLKNITTEDILNIESCVDKNRTQWMRKHHEIYGKFSKKSSFKLLPGHVKIIFGISEHHKRKAIIASESDQNIKHRVEAKAGYENVSLVVGFP